MLAKLTRPLTRSWSASCITNNGTNQTTYLYVAPLCWSGDGLALLPGDALALLPVAVGGGGGATSTW
eukprot:4347028-Heterocapsa_arctica.AAC.1